jgi:hypothetical protein
VPRSGPGWRARAHVGDVPVHVHHDHVERKALRLVFLHDLAELVRGVGPVARVPGSERVAPRHGHGAGDGGERLERGAVVQPVAEQADGGGIGIDQVPLAVGHHEPVEGIIQDIPEKRLVLTLGRGLDPGLLRVAHGGACVAQARWRSKEQSGR